MSDVLQKAITAIKSGDKKTGRRLLLEILKSDQRNETAWLWMTQVATSNDERIKCLQNVLKINPDNEMAKRGLAKLQQSHPTIPPPKVGVLSEEKISTSSQLPKSKDLSQSESKSSIGTAEPVKSPPFLSSPDKASSKKNGTPPTSGARIKNRNLTYMLIVATIGIIIVTCLGCFAFSLISTSSPSLRATRTARAIVQATASSTSTATPTFTPTPSFVLQLPQELENDDGLVFTINRVDFLTSIDTSMQRHAPQNGIFLWLTGTVNNSTNGFDCIRGDEFTLRNDEKKYQMLRENAEAIGDVYSLNYPGFFLGQCLDSNETVDSFLIFDAPKEAENLWLELGDTEIRLGQLSVMMEATPIPILTPTPRGAALQDSTPSPTNTPSPTDTPTSTPEVLECKRDLELFDLDKDSLEIVDSILGDAGCIESFALYEPQSNRLSLDVDIVISANGSREQVLQTVYDINKRLFTDNSGITCVSIFVYPPYNRTIPGVNQALGYELAKELSGRWDRVSAQEWWSWIEANRTPSEEISENCEMTHWAQWDERSEFAPWK